MNFEHFPVYDYSSDFGLLIKHGIVNYFLTECGGYIAGGLSEKEYSGYKLTSYLKNDPGHYNGDVDIYFRTQEGLEKAVKYAYDNSHTSVEQSDEFSQFGYPTHNLAPYESFINYLTDELNNKGRFDNKTYNRNQHVRHIEKSSVDISHQVFVDVKLSDVDTDYDVPIKVQLVGKDFIGDPEKVFETFDFTNVQIAYYIKEGQLFCCKRKTNNKDKTRLEIVNSHSPLLMHRIHKYMAHRGYSGITEDSKQHVVDWLIRARSGHFTNPVLGITLWGDALNNMMIRRAIAERIIPDDALSLIVGKVITERRVYRGYRRYEYVEIDEALEAIKERSRAQGN